MKEEEIFWLFCSFFSYFSPFVQPCPSLKIRFARCSSSFCSELSDSSTHQPGWEQMLHTLRDVVQINHKKNESMPEVLSAVDILPVFLGRFLTSQKINEEMHLICSQLLHLQVLVIVPFSFIKLVILSYKCFKIFTKKKKNLLKLQ